MEYFAERMCRLMLRLEFLVADIPEAILPPPVTEGPHLRISSPLVRSSAEHPEGQAESSLALPTAEMIAEAPVELAFPSETAMNDAPVEPSPANDEAFYTDDSIAEWLASVEFARLSGDIAAQPAEPPLIVLSSSSSETDRPLHGTTVAIRGRKRRRHHHRSRPYAFFKKKQEKRGATDKVRCRGT